jgi:hypothetical protein
MILNPEWIVAICAGVTLLILWSTTIIGGAIWLMRQLKELKIEILADFQAKHKENEKKVEALQVLVTRHETILEPEFNGAGSTPYVPNRRHR